MKAPISAHRDRTVLHEGGWPGHRPRSSWWPPWPAARRHRPGPSRPRPSGSAHRRSLRTLRLRPLAVDLQPGRASTSIGLVGGVFEQQHRGDAPRRPVTSIAGQAGDDRPALQGGLVEGLDGAGTGGGQRHRIVEGLGEAPVPGDHQDGGRRFRGSGGPHRLGQDRQRALGPTQQGERIDAASPRRKPVDPVAAEAPGQFGQGEATRAGPVRGSGEGRAGIPPQAGDPVVAGSARASASVSGIGSARPRRPVVEDDVEGQDVAMGPSVDQRPLPGGVGRDHAADGGPIEGRGVGRPEQAIGGQVGVEGRGHDPGLDPGDPGLLVDLDDAVQVSLDPRRPGRRSGSGHWSPSPRPGPRSGRRSGRRHSSATSRSTSSAERGRATAAGST